MREIVAAYQDAEVAMYITGWYKPGSSSGEESYTVRNCHVSWITPERFLDNLVCPKITREDVLSGRLSLGEIGKFDAFANND